jgi:hypothetical protein
MQAQQTGFMQPQITGFAPGGFLQPQMTGAMANPFRQSVFPQQQPFGQPSMSPFSGQQMPQSSAGGVDAFNAAFQDGNATTASPTPLPKAPASASTSTTFNGSSNAAEGQARSASVPLVAQKTGSRNPFAPPPGSAPDVPKPAPSAKGPTLFELAFGGAQGPTPGGGGNYGLGAGAWNAGQQGSPSSDTTGPQSVLVPQKTGLIGNIASEFVGLKGTSISGTASPAMASTNANAVASPSTSSAPTNELANGFAGMNLSPYAIANSNGGSSTTPSAAAPLQPQATGFGGSLVKPFVPESTFGQSLAANGGAPSPAPIPANMTGNPFARLAASSPAPGSASTSSNVASLHNNNHNSAATPSTSAFTNGTTFTGPQQASNAHGSNLFGGASITGTSASQFGSGATALGAQLTGFAGSTVKPFQPSSAFGSAAFGNGHGQPAQQQQQQQQQGAITGSLF